jgi:hypothetical protein
MIFNGSVQRTVLRVKKANNLDEHMLLSELFPDSFMKEHTQFSSIKEFLENGNFIYSSNEAIAAVDEEDLNGHIFITTDFNTWEEMTDAAAREYRAKGRGRG